MHLVCDLSPLGEAQSPHNSKSKWKVLLETKIQENLQSPRFECDDEANPKYCHPATLLKALSLARLDDSVDKVGREAVIAVDVGDVTLVSGILYRCISRL